MTVDVTQAGADWDRDSIVAEVLRIVQHMTSDWELESIDPIVPSTRLVADLAFESLDIVQLVVAIQESFHRRDLPFEHLLLVNGQYVDDLTLTQVVDFLMEHLAQTVTVA
jgi:acyl carrier protein